jgi:hypothetical protein
MTGKSSPSNPNHAAAVTLKIEPYCSPNQQRTGEPMSTQSARAKHLTSEHAEKVHDILLVASFGLWALVIGISPVLAYNMLMSA